MKSFNDHTGLRNKDKGWMTPFDFHGSKPVEYYYLHMIGHISLLHNNSVDGYTICI